MEILLIEILKDIVHSHTVYAQTVLLWLAHLRRRQGQIQELALELRSVPLTSAPSSSPIPSYPLPLSSLPPLIFPFIPLSPLTLNVGPLKPARGLGSAVSFPIGVRGTATAENEFVAL